MGKPGGPHLHREAGRRGEVVAEALLSHQEGSLLHQLPLPVLLAVELALALGQHLGVEGGLQGEKEMPKLAPKLAGNNPPALPFPLGLGRPASF